MGKKLDVEFFMKVIRHPCVTCIHFISDHKSKTISCALGRNVNRKRKCSNYQPLWDPKRFRML